MKKLIATTITALFALTSLVPSAGAFTLTETIIKTTIIDYNDIYIDDIGIDTTYPQYFYADVCTDGMTAEGVVINYHANGLDKNMELNAVPEDDCKRYYSWNYSYFQLEEGDTTTLTVTIDYYDNFDEDNETNNEESEAITISSTATETTYPDLYISDVGISSDYTKFYAKVCGLDTNDLSTINLKFTAGSSSKTKSITAPASDACVTEYVSIATYFSSLSEGTKYTLTVEVDPANAVTEEDETNNSLSETFTIPSTTTDLKLSAIGLADDGTSFYATICGTDSGSVGSTEITFSANNYDNKLTFTAPGDGVCKTIYSWGTSVFSINEGTAYTLTVTLDPDDSISEADETNNELTTTFAVEEDATTDDLYISEIGASATYSAFYAKVCSSEDTSTSTSVSLKFTANGYSNTKTITNPSGGSCSTFYSDGFETFSIDKLGGGTYSLTAEVDSADVLDESSESNNSSTLSVTFADDDDVNPDLYVGDISNETYLTITIGNKGSQDYPSTAGGSLYIYIDDVLEWTYSLSTLADQTFRDSGDTSEVQPQVLDGTPTIKACLYPDSSTSDANSSNDCRTETVTSGSTDSSSATYDLWVSDSGIESDYTNLYMTVCADEDTKISKFAYINFNANGYDNTLGIMTPADGNCKTFYSWGMSNFSLTDGSSYTATATVDYYDYIDETYETNNADTFTVTLPTDSETLNDGLLFNPSIMFVRIGDLDYHNDGDIKQEYTGMINSSDTGQFKVIPVTDLLFEDSQTDSYDETTAGVSFTSEIYNHWDGILLYVYPVNDDTDPSRYIDIWIADQEIKIYGTDDLGTYDLDSSTDNKIDIQLIGYLNDYSDDETDNIFDNLRSLSDNFNMFGQDMEDSSDDDVNEKFQGILDNFLKTPLLESDSATNSFLATITASTVEDAVELYEENQDGIKETLYEDGVNPFKDVDIGEWYGEYIKSMNDKGIISGYKDEDGNALGEFKPGNNVTVAEALKIILETTGQGSSDRIPNLGSAANHWASGYIAKAEELELSIIEDEDLDLNREATRSEIIKMLFEALEIEVPSYDESSFTDDSLAGTALSEVEYAKDMGIISGYSNGTFGYSSSINRAEVSKIIIETIDTLGL